MLDKSEKRFNHGYDDPEMIRPIRHRSSETENPDWKQLVIQRGLSIRDIVDPKTWLEEQIALYANLGSLYVSTLRVYINALKEFTEQR